MPAARPADPLVWQMRHRLLCPVTVAKLWRSQGNKLVAILAKKQRGEYQELMALTLPITVRLVAIEK